jgi:FMN phosphatase YigB (HAD superfamily)
MYFKTTHVSPKIKIAAFDVFDTVLTRLVGSPNSVFLLLGRRLSLSGLITCSPEVFANARLKAERRAHIFRNAATTLEDIYNELHLISMIPSSTAAQLMDAEYSLEAELLRVVPESRARILEARRHGHRIVFISDTYFSTTFVFQQLLTHCLAEVGDGCYTSSAHKKWKRDGKLFLKVMDEERISKDEMCFFGNDYKVDVVPARRNGIAVEHITAANSNRYELSLESHSLTTGGLSSAIAGASRLARLNVLTCSSREESIRDFAASVVAPTLIGYTIWLLNSAQKLGLTRLYFLSRDGEILLKIAKILSVKLNLHCELHYLYSSRKAWGIPSIIKGEANEISWLLERDPGPDLSRLLSRLDISPFDIRIQLEKLGFYESKWNSRFSSDDLAIIKSEDFLQMILPFVMEKANQQRRLLMEYLEGHGLLADTKYGLVDVGWHATLQDSLATILTSKDFAIGTGLYFGLISYDSNRKFGFKMAYFMDLQKRTGFRFKMPDLYYLIETMCAGSEGSLSCYTKSHQNDTVSPHFKNSQNHSAINWGLPILHITVESVANNLLLDRALLQTDSDIRGATADILENFWFLPTRNEAHMIAAFPFEGGMDMDVQPWQAAKEYSWRQAIATLLNHRSCKNQGVFWREGSLALTPTYKRIFFSAFFLFRNNLRRLTCRVSMFLRSGFLTGLN